MTAALPALCRIGEAAAATGLTPRAIRYYEQLGLLKPATHALGANRRYDDNDLERLQLIKQLREVVGLSLADIQDFLHTEDVRRALKAEYLASVDPAEQLQVLERFEPVLSRRIDLLERKLGS